MMKTKAIIKTPFELAIDENSRTLLNGKDIPYWKYALAIHKRDLSLWAKGMKISRHFKVTTYKKYYGIKGRNGQEVLDAFMVIYNKYF